MTGTSSFFTSSKEEDSAPEILRRKLFFRAWHRGTKEADLLIGGFADRYLPFWNMEEMCWFRELLKEQDADILAWATGSAPAPEKYQGPLLHQLMNLDYLGIRS